MQSAPLSRYWPTLILGTTALVAVALAASAAKSQTIMVTAEIQATCSVVADATLDFGFYEGTQKDASTQFDINCGGETRVLDVTLDAGEFPNGGSRRMRHDGGSTLDYDLYEGPASGGSLWAGGIAKEISVSSSGTTVVVGGRLPSGQSGPVGAYTDTVQITLSVSGS